MTVLAAGKYLRKPAWNMFFLVELTVAELHRDSAVQFRVLRCLAGKEISTQHVFLIQTRGLPSFAILNRMSGCLTHKPGRDFAVVC